MRSSFILALVLMLVIVTVHGDTGGSSNYLVATKVTTSPTNIYAGNDVNLTFMLYNTYTYSADNVLVQLMGSYPLLAVSPAQGATVNTIPSGINQYGLPPFSFTLHVDPNALAGTYTVNVVATYSTESQSILANGAIVTPSISKTDTIPISLQIRGKPHLSASIISQGIEPGVSSPVTISVLNDGTDTAKAAAIELNSTNVFDILGTSFANLGDIAPGQRVEASFTIRARQNTESGKQQLPVSLDYRDNYGKDFSYLTSVPILVSVYEPSLQVSVSDTTDRPRAGQDATIVLNVRNSGDGIAKDAIVQVSGAGPVEVKWPTSYISLGDIQSGATVTATIKVKIQDNVVDKSVQLPVRLTYSNSNKQKQYDIGTQIDVGLERAADFQILSTSSNLLPNALYSPVEFTIKNTGNVPAREISVTLSTQYPMTPSGKNQYIQELDPGANTTIVFHVDTDSKAVPQTYPIDVYLQWKEEGDQVHSTTKSYSLAVVNGSTDYTLYIAIAGVAVLLVAGYFIRKQLKVGKATSH